MISASVQFASVQFASVQIVSIVHSLWALGVVAAVVVEMLTFGGHH